MLLPQLTCIVLLSSVLFLLFVLLYALVGWLENLLEQMIGVTLCVRFSYLTLNPKVAFRYLNLNFRVIEMP